MHTSHPDNIIGSSVFHNVNKKKVVFAYQCVSVSEAVPSIFHCRGGCFLLSGTVFPIMCVNTVHYYTMHMSASSELYYDVSMLMYPL